MQSGSDSEVDDVGGLVIAAASMKIWNTTRIGGSRPERATKRNLNLLNPERRLQSDYFSRFTPSQTTMKNWDFELQWRMPRSIYEIIRKDIIQRNDFFGEKWWNRCEKCEHGKQNIATLIMVAKGRDSRSVFQQTWMSESLDLESMKQLLEKRFEEYEQKWFSKPIQDEIIEIKKQ